MEGEKFPSSSSQQGEGAQPLSRQPQARKYRFLCRYFANGRCLKGTSCEFSHERDAVCRYYLTGKCTYGSRCRYAHVRLEESNLGVASSTASSAFFSPTTALQRQAGISHTQSTYSCHSEDFPPLGSTSQVDASPRKQKSARCNSRTFREEVTDLMEAIDLRPNAPSIDVSLSSHRRRILAALQPNRCDVPTGGEFSYGSIGILLDEIARKNPSWYSKEEKEEKNYQKRSATTISKLTGGMNKMDAALIELLWCDAQEMHKRALFNGFDGIHAIRIKKMMDKTVNLIELLQTFI